MPAPKYSCFLINFTYIILVKIILIVCFLVRFQNFRYQHRFQPHSQTHTHTQKRRIFFFCVFLCKFILIALLVYHHKTFFFLINIFSFSFTSSSTFVFVFFFFFLLLCVWQFFFSWRKELFFSKSLGKKIFHFSRTQWNGIYTSITKPSVIWHCMTQIAVFTTLNGSHGITAVAYHFNIQQHNLYLSYGWRIRAALAMRRIVIYFNIFIIRLSRTL